MLLLLVLGAVALAVRWRRGTPIERAQIKWLVAATAFLVVAEVINVVTFRADQLNAVTVIATSAAIALIPIAIGIAILRYRLFEIDRLVSRTIAYTAVTAVLLAVFVGIILLLQTVLEPYTQGQTIAVAASTLVVFALFQPVRRRVQHAVDRRFDRARIDADQTSSDFAERLRHEVDIETVTSDLRGTVRAAIKPTGVSLWVGLVER
jgi:hypothetical protein